MRPFGIRRRPWSALLIVILSVLGGAASGQDGAARSEPLAWRATGPATSITITANGARSLDVSGEETAAACSRFLLRAKDVREFFKVAQPVDFRAYHHDLEMSRCHARGRIRFADGSGGHFWIDRERRGRLLLTSGRTIFLYCRRCTARLFEPVYDPDRDG